MKLRHSIGLIVSTLLFIQSAKAESLIDIYQQALTSAPQIKAAGYKVGVGSAESGQAMGQMLPQITGSANWSENSAQQMGASTLSYRGVRYFVSLSQTIMDFGKYWEWQRTKKQEEQFNVEQDDALQNIMLDVVKRYFAVLDAEDQLQLINSELQTTENTLKQFNRLLEKQLAKVTDVYEIEARVDQLKADVIEAESILLTANESLTELTNQSAGKLNRLRDNIQFNELNGDLPFWIEVAKNENPTLAAQRTAIDVASANVAAQKAKFLPVVDMQLYFYDTNTGYQSLRLANEFKTQVAAINVNVPIFTGGTATERVNEAQSNLGIKQQESEAKIRAIIKETSDAYSLSNANARRIRAAQKALESASKSYEAMQKGFKYGTKTMRDVLEAEQAQFKAKRDLAKSKYNYIANRVRFLKAIGTINEDNLIEVNQWLAG